MIRSRARAVCTACCPALALTLLVGCGDWKWDRPLKPTPPEAPPPQRPAAATDAVVAGSIAAQTYLADVEPLAVRGFGLVIGLGDKGSSDCPTVVREYLAEYLTKQIAPQGSGRRPKVSPEELIDSLDTAVVEVVASIPPGAPAGMRMDLQVTAIVGSSTQSLEGGLLLPTELRLFDRAATGRGMIQGNVLARAGGPVFVNPFATDARTGYVLGGGRVSEARPFRLVLVQPNYQLAQQIERRINERFGPRPRVAEAVSRGLLTLNTPPAYATEPDHFRRLVVRLYLDNQPGFVERKLQELGRVAVAGEARLEAVAYAWEAFGRSVLPRLQPLYAAGDAGVRFYAARAGARLNDGAALAVLAEIAAARGDPFRLLAVRELGASSSPQAALPLVPLLSDADQEIRIAAYLALQEHNHPAIRSLPFRCVLDRAQLNCVLDLVECDGPALIYVRRTRAPRIAVFGRQVTLHAPVFYRHPDESVTLVSAADTADVKLFARWGRKLSDEILVPPRVSEVVGALADLPEPDPTGRLRGLGLPYSRVVQVLARLCEDGTIPARFVVEQTSLTDILGPEIAPERPETDHEPVPVPDAAPRSPREPGRDEAPPSARPERDAPGESR